MYPVITSKKNKKRENYGKVSISSYFKKFSLKSFFRGSLLGIELNFVPASFPCRNFCTFVGQSTVLCLHSEQSTKTRKRLYGSCRKNISTATKLSTRSSIWIIEGARRKLILTRSLARSIQFPSRSDSL